VGVGVGVGVGVAVGAGVGVGVDIGIIAKAVEHRANNAVKSNVFFMYYIFILFYML
jgi:hypothetical protein